MHVLIEIRSAFCEMMVEVRGLEVLLNMIGVRLETRWITSEMNQSAEALS